MNRSWWIPRALDDERLAEAAALVLGQHDFRAFTPTETQHTLFTRTVERAEWARTGDHLVFEITARSYLRHMVRTLVGTMLELEPAEIAQCLQGTAAERSRADGASLGAVSRVRCLLTGCLRWIL